jgi:hypothetical protein
MLSFCTVAAPSGCWGAGVLERRGSGLKPCLASGDHTIAALPMTLRSTTIFSAGPNGAYRSQEALGTQGHLGNVRSIVARLTPTACRQATGAL